MIKNYLITTYRNLVRNKVNTVINITGLAISIACCIFVYVFIQHEKTFDKFHSKADRIYRIVFDDKDNGNTSYNGVVPFPTATALRNDFPQLETVTQLYTNHTAIVSITGENGQQKVFEDNELTYADAGFFKTFDFTILAGNKTNLLTEPNEVILSKKLADNYFGKIYAADYAEIVGRMITVNKKVYRISAVMADMPRNSNVACHMLLPFSVFEKDNQELVKSWKDLFSQSYTFVTLPKNHSAAQFDAALVSFKNKYLDKIPASRHMYHPQPLAEVHTDNKYGGTQYSTPSVLILAFLIMGVIVLLTSCINFINLATAQSFKRAKEIGIRKTLGSRSYELILRFMSETFILILIATGIGIFIANYFLNAFNNYLSFIVELDLHIDLTVIYFLLALSLFITLLAGYYPAKIMAGFQPIEALKQSVKAKHTGFSNRFSMRKALVVTQFMVSQLLIIGTIVVASQMKYFYSRDVGYQKDNILTVELPENDAAKRNVFRNALMNQSGIKNVSFSSGPPTSAANGFSGMRKTTMTEKDNVSTERKFIDPNYLTTYKIKLLAGRDLKESDLVTLTDSVKNYNVLLNKKATEAIGFATPEAALNQQVLINDHDYATVVGVTDDFFNVSLQNTVSPCLLFYGSNWVGMANIQLSGTNNASTFALVEKNWKALYPDHMYKQMTLTEYMTHKAFYVLEDIMYQGFKIFVVLSILIGCLGLYGLVAFLSAQRQKEIGIRKVLGASVQRIVYMFSKEFMWLVIIAFVIAAPLAYLAMNAWLQGFANRIDLHPVYFAIALFASVLIASVTISFQAIKSALANPVKSLRSE